MKIIYTQPNQEITKLQKDLNRELTRTAKSIGRDPSWFRYARRIGIGYRFIENREKQRLVLKKVLDRVSINYPEYTTGQLADILSELVNY